MRNRQNKKRFNLVFSSILVLTLVFGSVPMIAWGNPTSPSLGSGINATTGSAIICNINHPIKMGDVVEKARAFPHNGFTETPTTYGRYSPKYTSPYRAGSVSSESETNTLNALKMVRFLAGLPIDNLRFTTTLNEYAQHGSVLLAASNQFTNEPSKPSDMDNDFFNLAQKGCRESLIANDTDNVARSVFNFVTDDGKTNIGTVAHRRWLFVPGAEEYGIGFAKNTTSGDGLPRINLHVMESPGPDACEADSYIAWPNAGDFPIQYFINSNDLTKDPNNQAWSVNLGAEYAEPIKDDLRITITNAKDNKVWVLDRNTQDLSTISNYERYGHLYPHLSVDNTWYGVKKAIIFRPDSFSLGRISDGDIFNVKIEGLKKADMTGTTLEYKVKFFDLQKRVVKTSLTDVVSASWFFEPVRYVYEHGYMNGTAANIFEPNKAMNRSEMVQMLYNLEGQPEGGSNPFVDVSSNAWYYNAVSWASDKGIIEGYTSGGKQYFNPQGNIEREQTAKVMREYARYKGYDLSSTGSLNFNDNNKISAWAQEPVKWAYSQGLMRGKPGNLFDPKGSTSRAEISQLLMNFFEDYLG